MPRQPMYGVQAEWHVFVWCIHGLCLMHVFLCVHEGRLEDHRQVLQST